MSSITLVGTVGRFDLQANNGLPNPTLNGVGVFTLTTNTVVSPNHGITWDDQLGHGIVFTTNNSLVPAAPADLSGDISSTTSGSMSVIARRPPILVTIHCYGLAYNDPAVCSGHGQCMYFDLCGCDLTLTKKLNLLVFVWLQVRIHLNLRQALWEDFPVFGRESYSLTI